MKQNNELLYVLFKVVEHRQNYREKVRHFCLGLHFHSPRAYELVRKAFNNHLRHERTIQRWYQKSDIQSEPGVHEETMQKLKKIGKDFADSNGGNTMICSLTFDEMRLRKQIHWSIDQMDYFGQVNNLNKNEIDKTLVAKEAIVFLLNGINSNFEFPVSYY